MEVRLGVDVGGTFTDLVALREGDLVVEKTPTVPGAQEEGVSAALDSLPDREIGSSETDFFAHGTTVATNAVLERDWAETAMVTTRGFRDVLEIGRQTRPSLYDLMAEKPRPVVERRNRLEVRERMDERGEVLEPLDEEDVREVVEEIEDSEVGSVAVSLLFSYENPEHESMLKEVLESELDVYVSASSRVLPEIGEYERTVATCLNAALKPVMDDYLSSLKDAAEGAGVVPEPRVMQSNGGLATLEGCRERPLSTALSGPAAGVKGASYLAGLIDARNVITMDMGGTSCDVSLIEGGEPTMTAEDRLGGYPLALPSVDVHTVGSGGGSMAWIDPGGALRVGPDSAGADPGPVCYGRGGTTPTVTDAHFVLGRIDPGAFLPYGQGAGIEKVRRVVREEIAEPLDMGVEEAAAGTLEVAEANMAGALRKVSVERGHDPREFALVAFGGAGPLHAARLAEKLDIPRVLVPRNSGVLSAFGLLVTDVVYDFGLSRVRRWSRVEPEELEAEFRDLKERGMRRLSADGVDEGDVVFERSLDMRYEGQSFSLNVEAPYPDSNHPVTHGVEERFHARHRERYGSSYPDEPVELVALRVMVRAPVEDPELSVGVGGDSLNDAVRGTRRVRFGEKSFETPVYAWDDLPANSELGGPAVVEGPASTALLPPRVEASIDGYRNIQVAI